VVVNEPVFVLIEEVEGILNLLPLLLGQLAALLSLDSNVLLQVCQCRNC
jgi:hypothetical protein